MEFTKKHIQYYFLLVVLLFSLQSSAKSSSEVLATNFLIQTKKGDLSTAKLFKDSIQGLSSNELETSLSNQNNCFVFWINLYNALLMEKIKTYQEEKILSSFYKDKLITINGLELSLKIIRDNILRKKGSEKKFGKFRPKEFNNQIHFALASGKKYSPQIAIYEASRIDQQLKSATGETLRGMCHMDTKKKTVFCPPFLKEFKSDFEGKKGIKRLLKRYSVIIYDEYRPVFEKKDNSKLIPRFTYY